MATKAFWSNNFWLNGFWDQYFWINYDVVQSFVNILKINYIDHMTINKPIPTIVEYNTDLQLNTINTGIDIDKLISIPVKSPETMSIRSVRPLKIS